MSGVGTISEPISEPGIYRMTDAEYQADPCAEISLRSSAAWGLVKKGGCPLRVWHETTRLNPLYIREEKKHFDLGKACHSVLLGKGAAIATIPGYGYSKNEPKGPTAGDKQKMKEAAYAVGKIPLQEHEIEQVHAMVEAARRQMAQLADSGDVQAMPFSEPETERVIIWREGDVTCRAMLDGLPDDSDGIDELKTEGRVAEGSEWQWTARKLGYIFRARFYARGLQKLSEQGILTPPCYSPHIRFWVIETEPPYLLGFNDVDDEMLASEDARVTAAIKLWDRCAKSGVWPGYKPFTIGLTEREKQVATLGNGQADKSSPYYHLASEDVT